MYKTLLLLSLTCLVSSLVPASCVDADDVPLTPDKTANPTVHIAESIGFNLPGADGEEVAIRSALIKLRKGQAAGLPDEKLGELNIILLKAENAYRATLSRLIFNRYLEVRGIDKAKFKEQVFSQNITQEEKEHRWFDFLSKYPGDQYRRAANSRLTADKYASVRLKKYLEKTPGFKERWIHLLNTNTSLASASHKAVKEEDLATAIKLGELSIAIKARIETQLRLTRLWESAAFEVLTAIEPRICISLPEILADDPFPDDSLKNRFDGRCTSQTTYRLAELGERIAKNFPDIYARNQEEIDAEVPTSMYKEMAAIRLKLDLEEYRRLALTGLIVNPETTQPIGGMLRIRIAQQAEQALIQYLKRTGKAAGPFTKMVFGEPLRALGSSLEKELEKNADYKLLKFLDHGEEPTPQFFFLIAARVIRAEQEGLLSAYRDGYLGGGTTQVDLEQLLRVANLHGDDDDNIDDVKMRVERYLKDMDTAHDALISARKLTPQELEQKKPRHYILMREMGFIAGQNDDPEGARYVIPENQRSFRSFAQRARGTAYLPGKGVLSAINLRNAAQILASAIIPELAAARFAHYGRNIFLSQRAYAAATLAGEAMAGTLVDASLEHYWNWVDAKPGEKIKGVEWDRLILESIVLGSATQFTSGAADTAFDVAVKTLGSETPKSALYKAMKKHPLLAKHLEAYARTSLNLATETSMTTFYQMYIQGNMDETSWKTILVNAALSNAIGAAVDKTKGMVANKKVLVWHELREYLPKKIRPYFDANPKLAAETVKNVNRQLQKAQNALEEFQNRTSGEKVTAKRLFRDLSTGQLNWRDLTKVIYPALKKKIAEAMENLRLMRKEYFSSMEVEAKKLAIKDINRFFNLLEIKANKEIQDRAELLKKLDELKTRREAELRLVQEEIIAPGSEDPTSDMDRSSRSVWVRRHLRAIYEARLRFSTEDAIPTSARAFDVNEYITVIPFIKESGKYMAAMRKSTANDGPGNLRHSVAMEALSMAAAMRFMDTKSRLRFLENLRVSLKRKIDAGEAMSVDLGRLERQIDYAMTSIAKSKEAFDTERKLVVKRNPGLSNDEIDLLTTDAIYDRKMTEISNKQFQLSQMPDQHSKEALDLRAEILRDMAVGLRSGIETYSSPVGIDIIVSRIQGAKRPDGKKKSVSDRLDDPQLTLKGELADYSEHDIRAMINDQIMFITEHVQAFNRGHESVYETGRALGKYLERAFLGMKILGLDIAEVRKRPEYDPHRRLLEAAQSLVAVKNDPVALLERVKLFSRTVPKSHDAGMAEIFYLIEKVIPEMDKLTGVRVDEPVIDAASIQRQHQKGPLVYGGSGIAHTSTGENSIDSRPAISNENNSRFASYLEKVRKAVHVFKYDFEQNLHGMKVLGLNIDGGFDLFGRFSLTRLAKKASSRLTNQKISAAPLDKIITRLLGLLTNNSEATKWSHLRKSFLPKGPKLASLINSPLDLKVHPKNKQLRAQQPDFTFRQLKMVARMRWRDDLERVRRTLGPDYTVELVAAELFTVTKETQWVDQQLEKLKKLAEEYRVKDWKRVYQLQNALFEAKMMSLNLPDPKEPLLGKIAEMKDKAEKELEDLRRPIPYSGLIEERLYAEGSFKRFLMRKEYLQERRKWLQKDLQKEKKFAEKARRLMAFDLTGRWQCESETISNIVSVITVNGEEFSMAMSIPPSDDTTAIVKAKRRWGMISGTWQVTKGNPVNAAGFAEALPTDDGKEIHFTTESTNDPAFALNWSRLICRHRGISINKTKNKPFMSVSYSPQDDDSPYVANWSVDVNGKNSHNIRIRRGRKIYFNGPLGMPPSKLKPGKYLISMASGPLFSRLIEIKPNMTTKIFLRPASFNLAYSKDILELSYKLHPAGIHGAPSGPFTPNRPAQVLPGKYDLEIITVAGSSWVTGLNLDSGKELEIELQKRVGFLIFPPGKEKNLFYRRDLVDGAGERTWLGGSFSGDKYPLPPGKYDIKWTENNKAHKLQVTLEAGEREVVKLP